MHDRHKIACEQSGISGGVHRCVSLFENSLYQRNLNPDPIQVTARHTPTKRHVSIASIHKSLFCVLAGKCAPYQEL